MTILESSAAAGGATWLRSLDSRSRILAAVLLAVVIALLHTVWATLAALLASLLLLIMAKLPWGAIARRLFALNLMLLLLVLLLPLTWAGPPDRLFLGLAWHAAGLHAAILILLKANAIYLLATILPGSCTSAQLGHALQQLHLPAKLVLLFILTVRYVDVLHAEYLRLRLGMRARCFQLRLDLHSLRVSGTLAGMLIVRGHLRSERVMRAMKCRGFTGRFIPLEATQWRLADHLLLLASLLLALVLLAL